MSFPAALLADLFKEGMAPRACFQEEEDIEADEREERTQPVNPLFHYSAHRANSVSPERKKFLLHLVGECKGTELHFSVESISKERVRRRDLLERNG